MSIWEKTNGLGDATKETKSFIRKLKKTYILLTFYKGHLLQTGQCASIQTYKETVYKYYP